MKLSDDFKAVVTVLVFMFGIMLEILVFFYCIKFI